VNQFKNGYIISKIKHFLQQTKKVISPIMSTSIVDADKAIHPMSAHIYILCTEILAKRIRNYRLINGIYDDTSLILYGSVKSLSAAMKEIIDLVIYLALWIQR